MKHEPQHQGETLPQRNRYSALEEALGCSSSLCTNLGACTSAYTHTGTYTHRHKSFKSKEDNQCQPQAAICMHTDRQTFRHTHTHIFENNVCFSIFTMVHTTQSCYLTFIHAFIFIMTGIYLWVRYFEAFLLCYVNSKIASNILQSTFLLRQHPGRR